ncbi:hypothetical protein KN63_04680 [Smithella sp. F21]|jgi:hypothetical protein|nr:hypothetical protein KN63_04680 [Smithella sp. F21]
MNLIDELEKLGEQEVRKRLANNVYGDHRNPNNSSVQTWLRSKEVEGEEARSEEAITVAREANDLACVSNSIALEAKELARSEAASAATSARWAKIAAVIAAIAAIISTATTIIIALYIKNP